MEEAQRRVQGGVEKVMGAIDLPLRKLQAQTHRCAAACCEDSAKTMSQVQDCVSRCEASNVAAQEAFQQEMNNFQQRLTRCAQGCQDKILDGASSSPDTAERERLNAQMDKCSLKCADEHVDLLPKIQKRLLDAIAKSSK